MPIDNSILFGRLAIANGFLTPEQASECAHIQAENEYLRRIGAICLEKGYLSPNRLNALIQLQKKNFKQSPSYSDKPKEEISFGKLAVSSGMATALAVNTALRIQALLEEKAYHRKLGEILVRNGELTPRQVLEIVEMQGKRIGLCECGVQVNLHSAEEEEIRCPSCGGVIEPLTDVYTPAAFDPDDDVMLPSGSEARFSYFEHVKDKVKTGPPKETSEPEIVSEEPEPGFDEKSVVLEKDEDTDEDDTKPMDDDGHRTKVIDVDLLKKKGFYFASILVEKSYATRQQILEVMRKRSEASGNGSDLGEAMVEHGVITKEQLEEILSLGEDGLASEMKKQDEKVAMDSGGDTDFIERREFDSTLQEMLGNESVNEERVALEEELEPEKKEQADLIEESLVKTYEESETVHITPETPETIEKEHEPSLDASESVAREFETPPKEEVTEEELAPAESAYSEAETLFEEPAESEEAQDEVTEVLEEFAEVDDDMEDTHITYPEAETITFAAKDDTNYEEQGMLEVPAGYSETDETMEILPGEEPPNEKTVEETPVRGDKTDFIQRSETAEEADDGTDIIEPPLEETEEETPATVGERAEDDTAMGTRDIISGLYEEAPFGPDSGAPTMDIQASGVSPAAPDTPGISFSEYVLENELVSPEDFDAARKQWKDTLSSNSEVSFEDVLIKNGYLSLEQAESAYSELGVPVAVCPRCLESNGTGSFASDMTATCRACGNRFEISDQVKSALSDSKTFVAEPQGKIVYPSRPKSFFTTVTDVVNVGHTEVGEEILFGKIAIERGFATRQQVIEAASLQDDLPDSKLGSILVELGYLNEENVAVILELQKKALDKPVETSGRARLDGLFGIILLEKGWLEEKDLNAALRRKALLETRGENPRLGEVLVERGLLTPEQVQEVLVEQGKAIMVCPACREQFNVSSLLDDDELRCKRCATMLVFPEKLESVGTAGDTIISGSGSAISGAETMVKDSDVFGDDRDEDIDLSKPGVKKFEKYEILGELARGGMGIVYKAVHPGLKKVVALKVLIAGENATEDQIRRFYLEAEAAAKLHHPNIVPIHDVGVFKGRHFFTLEFIDGPSLRQIIKKERIPVNKAMHLMRDVCDAIHYAHENNIIHRDLKPANVMVDVHGKPQVMDFGLAKNVEGESNTITGVIMGTPAYMPPEQALGKISLIEPRSDVYSLGAVMYEMLTGNPPFEGQSPMQIINDVVENDPISPRRFNPKLPRDAETICLVAMEKEVGRRYPSALAMKEDIERYLAGDPIMARPQSILYKVQKKVKKHKGITVTAASALLLIVALVAIFFVNAASARAEARKKYSMAMAAGTLAVEDGNKKIAGIDPGAPISDRISMYRDAHAKFEQARDSFQEARNYAERLEKKLIAKVDEKTGEAKANIGLCNDKTGELISEKSRIEETRDKAAIIVEKILPLYRKTQKEWDALVNKKREFTEEEKKELRGNLETAEQELRKAYAIYSKDQDTISKLFTARYDLFFMHLLDKEFKLAGFYLRDAETLELQDEKLAEMLDEGKEELNRQEKVVGMFRNIKKQGDLYADEGKWLEAVDMYLRAQENVEKQNINLRDEDVLDWQKSLNKAYLNLYAGQAEKERRAGGLEEAVTLYDKALAYRKGLNPEEYSEVENARKSCKVELFERLLAEARTQREHDLVRALEIVENALEYSEAVDSELKQKAGSLKIRLTNEKDLRDNNRYDLVYVHDEKPVWLGFDPEGTSSPRANPTRDVQIEPYFIGKKEITNFEYKAFIDAGGYEDPRFWEPEAWKALQNDEHPHHSSFVDKTGKPGPATWKNGTFPAGRDNFPVAGVCYFEARAYCKWCHYTNKDGARLPTEDEWEKAASCEPGGIKRTYPWPGDWDPSKGNFRTISRDKAEDRSPYQVLNMAGNVFEWTENVVNPGPERPGVLRGGAATGEIELMKEWARCTHRKIPRPFFRSDYTGFRIARSAPLLRISSR